MCCIFRGVYYNMDIPAVLSGKYRQEGDQLWNFRFRILFLPSKRTASTAQISRPPAILADARKQADAIIADAKSQADKLRDDARAEIEVFKNSAQLSAQQAKRDAVLAFRQEVQQEFEKILAADVGEALDQQTLAKLIQVALQGEDVSGYAVEVGQVTDGIRQQLAQELKNGLELRPSKKVGAGFRLAAKDGSGYFDCSDQEIAEMLMPFFRDMHL